MIKLNDIIANDKNPRTIKGAKFEKLKSSIKEFEKMMELRPIVVDENKTILGGNMRFKALMELGYSEIPDEWVKVADKLTEDEKKRFIIEDNVPFGDWDWEVLTKDWDIETLNEWGLEINNFNDLNDPNAEWEGMPEFDLDDKKPMRQIIVSFQRQEDIDEFATLVDQHITDKTKSIWFPKVEFESMTDHIYETE